MLADEAVVLVASVLVATAATGASAAVQEEGLLATVLAETVLA